MVLNTECRDEHIDRLSGCYARTPELSIFNGVRPWWLPTNLLIVRRISLPFVELVFVLHRSNVCV